MITICFPHLILKSWTNYTCIHLSDTIVLHLCRMNRYDYGMQTQVYVFSFLLEQGVIATKCLAWLVSFPAVKRCMCLSNNVLSVILLNPLNRYYRKEPFCSKLCRHHSMISVGASANLLSIKPFDQFPSCRFLNTSLLINDMHRTSTLQTYCKWLAVEWITPSRSGL